MYTIYADDVCIYTDRFKIDEMIVINPKLTLEDNNAGTLEFVVPTSNTAYNNIDRMTTKIRLFRDDVEIWEGRVLSEDIDFYNNRSVHCEGALTYLNDSVQLQTTYTNVDISTYISGLLNTHNSNVDESRQFVLGNCTFTGVTSTWTTDFKTTMEYINELIDTFGGHFVVRKENGVRYLDYYEDYPGISDQTINFGKNLMDFTRSFDLSNLCTTIIPLGNTLGSDPNTGIKTYLTVASVNAGSIYVSSAEAVETYGQITKIVEWGDISDANQLLTAAQTWLASSQFDSIKLEINAVDLHMLDVDADSIDILDYVGVVSTPHGLNSYFPVTSVELDLANPAANKYTLGYEVAATLTDGYNSSSSKLSSIASNGIAAPSYRVTEVQRTSATEFTVTVVSGTTSVTNVFQIQTDSQNNTIFYNVTNDTTITFKGWS